MSPAYCNSTRRPRCSKDFLLKGLSCTEGPHAIERKGIKGLSGLRKGILNLIRDGVIWKSNCSCPSAKAGCGGGRQEAVQDQSPQEQGRGGRAPQDPREQSHSPSQGLFHSPALPGGQGRALLVGEEEQEGRKAAPSSPHLHPAPRGMEAGKGWVSPHPARLIPHRAHPPGHCTAPPHLPPLEVLQERPDTDYN